MTLSDLGPFYAYWAEWFAQPMAEKMKHLRDRSASTGWYFPPGTEAPGYGEADSKEYVHVTGTREDLARFGPDTARVFGAAYGLASIWLADRGLREVLGVIRPEYCRLRVLHYPPQPEGAVGAAHVDFDLLTVSLPGTAPGLEIADGWSGPAGHGGRWVPQPEQVDVHVGEMLEIYSSAFGARPSSDFIGDRQVNAYPAARHRVRTPPNTDRLKAVFFVLPPNEFVLRPGEACDIGRRNLGGRIDPECTSGCRMPFTAYDYLRGVLNKASPGAGVQR